MTHYQSLLLDPEGVRFGPAVALNPTTLLPDPQEETPHDCQQILAEVHGTREDLTDQPLADVEVTWFTDGSSYLLEGQRKDGAAVVDGTEVIWASAPPPGTSAQRAELIALTKLSRKQKVRKPTYILIADMLSPQHMYTVRYTGGRGY